MKILVLQLETCDPAKFRPTNLLGPEDFFKTFFFLSSPARKAMLVKTPAEAAEKSCQESLAEVTQEALGTGRLKAKTNGI